MGDHDVKLAATLTRSPAEVKRDYVAWELDALAHGPWIISVSETTVIGRALIQAVGERCGEPIRETNGRFI